MGYVGFGPRTGKNLKRPLPRPGEALATLPLSLDNSVAVVSKQQLETEHSLTIKLGETFGREYMRIINVFTVPKDSAVQQYCSIVVSSIFRCQQEATPVGPARR